MVLFNGANIRPLNFLKTDIWDEFYNDIDPALTDVLF